MTVPLGNLGSAIAAGHRRIRRNHTGIRTKTQGAALVNRLALTRHKINDLIGGFRIKFTGVGICQTRKTGVFDDHDLHAETDAEVWDGVFSAVLRSQDHALNSTGTKAAGHKNAIQLSQRILIGFRRQRFGVNPANADFGIQGVSRMAQGLRHRQIGIMQLHVFSDQADGDAFFKMVNALHQCLPLIQNRLRCLQPQLPAHDAGEVLLLQHQRRLVQVGERDIFDDAVRLYVAEQADFLENAVLQRLVTAQNHDVRLDAHALQLPDGVLGGLGLVLVGAPQEGHQRHMDKQAVLLADLQRNLTNCLQKGLRLDVTDGAANLRNHHVGIGLFANAIDEFLDLIGNMRNYLNCGTQKFSSAFLVQYIPVDLTGGQIGVLVQVFIDKALVVTQVQVCFCAVFCNIYLAVLIGTHGAGVHIDIGVQLLRGNFQSAGLQQASKGGSGNSFA